MLAYSRDPCVFFILATSCMFYCCVLCHSINTDPVPGLQRHKSPLGSFIRSSNANKTQLTRAKIKKDRDKKVFHFNETNKSVFMDDSERPAGFRVRANETKTPDNKMQRKRTTFLFQNKSEVYVSNNKTDTSDKVVRNIKAGNENNDGVIMRQGSRMQHIDEILGQTEMVVIKRKDRHERRRRDIQSGEVLEEKDEEEGIKEEEEGKGDEEGKDDEEEGKEEEGKEGFGLSKYTSSPLLLIPQLIVLGFSPVILANLKVMVMNALMLNNMALSSVLFMTLKNMVFGPTGGSKIKYPNYGYQNHHNGHRRRYYVYS